MASNIAQQRIQREFREVVKSEEVAASGVQVLFLVFFSAQQIRVSEHFCNFLSDHLKSNPKLYFYSSHW
jgi:hypothetical protein